jgi:HK97 gp10 family phage protein
MADGVTMEINGLKELEKAMRELPQNVARNGLRRAASSGAAIIRNAAKANVAEISKTGTLARAISMKREKSAPGKLEADYSIFVRQAKNGKMGQKNVKAYGKFDAYYWRFIEFGTKHIDKNQFMRPAFEAQKHAADTKIRTTLSEAIEKAANALSKK